MSMEQKFVLSADVVLEWLAKLRRSGQLPLSIVAALAFVDTLRGKRLELIFRTDVFKKQLEIVVRAVDEGPKPA